MLPELEIKVKWKEVAHSDKYNTEFWAFAAILVAAAVMLVFRNFPVGPIPAGDEFQYSMMSRTLPYTSDWIPNYVFYLVYSLTNYCGIGFFGCAKIINVAFLTVSAIFVYKTARIFVGSFASVATMVGFLVSPFNVYTTMFMPESMYAAIAWIIVYYLVSRGPRWGTGQSVVAGLAVAILSMTKPHGVLFGIVCGIAIAINTASGDRRALRCAINYAGVFMLSAIVMRLTIGYGFARDNGLNILGQAYTGIATRTSIADYLLLFWAMALSAFKHGIALALIAGVPLCVLISRAGESTRSNTPAAQINNFTLLFFALMVGVVAAFTAVVMGVAPSETLDRLHTRYYNFFVFLLYINLAAETARDSIPRLSIRIFAGVAIVLLAVFSLIYLPEHYTPGLVDNPDIHGIFWSGKSFRAFALLNIILITLWMFKRRMAQTLFLFVQLPLALFLSTQLLTQDIRGSADYHNAYPRAGDLARIIWGKPTPEYFVAGSLYGEQFHTMFHLDKEGTRIELSQGKPLERSSIPNGVYDGIVVGDNPITFGYDLVYGDDQIRVIRLKP